MNTLAAILVFSLFLAVKVYRLKTVKASPKKMLISITTFIAGIYFFLEFFLPKNSFGENSADIHSKIVDGLILMGAMAIGLGIINLLRVHFNNILKTKRGWPNSVALILGMFLTFFVQFFDFFGAEHRNSELDRISVYRPFIEQIEKDYKESKTPRANRIEFLIKELESFKEKAQKEDSPFNIKVEEPEVTEKLKAFNSSIQLAIKSTKNLKKSYEGSGSSSSSIKAAEESLQALYKSSFELSDYKYQNSRYKKASDFITQALFVPLGAAMFSLLAFYVASAAYRSFRIQTLEAAIMMSAALIVILGQIPFGPLYISPKLPAWREWLLEYISNPAFRAILFGSLIAGLAMAVRMWLTLEESPLESKELTSGDED